MILAIPTSSDPFYTQITRLDGVAYELSFRFNQRELAWYLSIALEDGTELARGIKIVVGIDLLRRRKHDLRLPQGLLVAVTNTNDDSPPGLADLGIDRRVTLTYSLEADLA